MQLRRNHTSKGASGKSFILRILVIFILLAGLLWYVKENKGIFSFLSTGESDFDSLSVSGETRTYIPSSQGVLLHKHAFSLSWNQQNKVADWVAYRLTSEQLKKRYFEKRYAFEADEDLGKSSTESTDYSGSGYDRGHLVPAADVSWDSLALQQSFLMSNIAPQKRGFNTGIWKELEKLSRDWVVDHDSLIIISGPVFHPEFRRIHFDKTKIYIPSHFFKIVCLEDPRKHGCISFLIPNEISYKHLRNYLTSIDDLEKITGIEFFEYMWDAPYENKIEATVDTVSFPFDEYKFRQRIEKWNYE